MEDGPQVKFLGGDQREAGGEIETRLGTEDGIGARIGAVAFEAALLEHKSKELMILDHDYWPTKRRRDLRQRRFLAPIKTTTQWPRVTFTGALAGALRCNSLTTSVVANVDSHRLL
jgi:hypothetical protein